ncbi:hypothetical protein LINGRAHAP2_LOCUS24160, partial [Linum grandiflorum]
RYARACVEIDLSRPLLGKYELVGAKFKLVYESLENLCMKCGLYGHVEALCPTHNIPPSDGVPQQGM